MAKDKRRRRKRQRKANLKHYQTFVEEEQQERSLGTQWQRELYISCINHSSSIALRSTLDSVQLYCSAFGKVTACYQVQNKPSNDMASHRPGWCYSIEAVVEMETAAAAAQILQQRQLLQFQGKRGPYQEQALPTPFGFLRSGNCPGCGGRIGRICRCQKYSK